MTCYRNANLLLTQHSLICCNIYTHLQQQFNCGHNTHLSQQRLGLTQPNTLDATSSTYHYQLQYMLQQSHLLRLNQWRCKYKWLDQGKNLVVCVDLVPSVSPPHHLCTYPRELSPLHLASPPPPPAFSTPSLESHYASASLTNRRTQIAAPATTEFHFRSRSYHTRFPEVGSTPPLV